MSPIKTDYAAQICKQFRGNDSLVAIAFCSKSSWPNRDFLLFLSFMPKRMGPDKIAEVEAEILRKFVTVYLHK